LLRYGPRPLGLGLTARNPLPRRLELQFFGAPPLDMHEGSLEVYGALHAPLETFAGL
jgi:hypothetical protein